MNPRALFLLVLLASSARAESFQAWAARGAREEREKDDKTAFQSYSNALSSWKDSDGKPGKAKVLCARAALRDRGGDEAGALEDYSACLALDKKNAKAFVRRGELRLKSGKLSTAIDDFYKAIALDIRYAVAYADRGRAYELQGDRGFAYEDYRRACGLGVKAACARAKELAPAAKARGKKKARGPSAAPHRLVVKITEDARSYSHVQKVAARTTADFTGKPDGGGDEKMIVSASLKPVGTAFAVALLAELDQAGDSRNFQLMTSVEMRPGDALTALDCGDIQVELALDATAGPAAPADAAWDSGGLANFRLTADAAAPAGRRRCRQILRLGEQSNVMYSATPDERSHPFILNASLRGSAGGDFELQYLLDETPLKLKGREALTPGRQHSVESSGASVAFLLEGAAPGSAASDAAEVEPAAEAEPAPEAEREPAAKPAKHRAARSTYNPRFGDCLDSLGACVEAGGAFGPCVGRAPACEQKAVKGCCPGACLEAYRKALNGGTSEAAAYRDIFVSDATCAAPPKTDDDD